MRYDKLIFLKERMLRKNPKICGNFKDKKGQT
jgi:hypothetical protein